MIATVGLVFGFRSSTNLAAAYGMAVTMTMVITTLLAFVVARELWRWSLWRAGADHGGVPRRSTSCSSARTSLKIQHGGWFPLVVAALVYGVMSTWKRGRELVVERLHASEVLARRVLQAARGDAARPCAWHGGVHDRASRRRAADSRASPQTQQGAAPADRAVDRVDAEHADDQRRRADRGAGASAAASTG